jgi:glutamate formiminotransferase
MKIIECIPNFSEGKDKNKVISIVEAVSGVKGVKVLDFSIDRDHNRSVLTIAGAPEDVKRGTVAACDRALKLIDMRKHSGVHPRIGAVDVVPFVPIRNVSMKEAVETAHSFGQPFGERNNIPVYFYGEAALDSKRRELSDIRRGEYEGLSEKINDPLWIPDAGPAVFNLRGGAVVVGARNPLIAFNINLDTNDLDVAQNIAKSIRYSSGGLKHVKAIGVPLESRKIVQVSMNLTNYKETSIRKVFDTVKEKAFEYNVDILESELIGLIPEAAFEDVTADYLKLPGFSSERIIETHLQCGANL